MMLHAATAPPEGRSVPASDALRCGTADLPLGTAISDAATLSGGSNPTGTITFSVLGPANPTCSGTPTLLEAAAVGGSGN